MMQFGEEPFRIHRASIARSPIHPKKKTPAQVVVLLGFTLEPPVGSGKSDGGDSGKSDTISFVKMPQISIVRKGLPSSDLELTLSVESRCAAWEGESARSENFNLRHLTVDLGIEPGDKVYVNWYRYDKIDQLRFDDVVQYLATSGIHRPTTSNCSTIVFHGYSLWTTAGTYRRGRQQGHSEAAVENS